MERGVVHDEEDLPVVALNEPLEESQEGVAIEDIGEAVGEFCVVQRQRAIHVGGLAFATCSYAWLHAYSMPRPVQGGVELEARLVFEEHDTGAPLRFFLIAGNVSRSHRSWDS